MRTPDTPSVLPCTWQSRSGCRECPAAGKLMCHFEKSDALHFFMLIFPFGVTTIAGAIRAGYGRYLVFWLLYAIFFFFVWEARVLCRHCPYWAEAGRILHCHANFGVFKIWKYHPGPMSRSEKLQFILGSSLVLAFPFPFLLLGREYLLALIGLSTMVSGIYLLRRNICTRCVNFSCPLNAVPKATIEAFLVRNPVIQKAWECRESSLRV